jgi:hypothetical protein
MTTIEENSSPEEFKEDLTMKHDPVRDPDTVAHVEPVPEEPVPEAPEIIRSASPLPPRILLIGGGIGIGVIILIGIIAAIVLLGGGGGGEALTTDSPIASHSDGISVALSGEGSARVKLGSIPRETFLNGEGGGDFKQAASSLPSYLEMKSPLYTQTISGDGSTLTSIVIPNDSQPYSTLDLYRWDAEAEQWVFVPSHINAETEVIVTDAPAENLAVFQVKQVTPLVSTELGEGQYFSEMAASTLNMVFPTGVSLGENNTLQGALAGGWTIGAGYAVIPVIQSKDQADLTALLNNEASVALHIEDIKAFVVGSGYHGVAIDYRGIAPEDRAAYASFIQRLGAAMDEYSKLLVVIIPEPEQDETGWNTGAYDWRTIGTSSDAVIVRMSLNPEAYSADGQMTRLLDWGVGEISRLKLHISFTSLSVTGISGEDFDKVTYDAAIEPLGGIKVLNELPEGVENFEPGTQLSFGLKGKIQDLAFDSVTGLYSYRAKAEDDAMNQIWIVSADAVRRRLDLAATYHIGGIVIDDMLRDGNDANLPTAVNQFKANAASSVPNQLVMKWTVNSASGAVLSTTTGVGTPLVWQAAENGEYVVQASILGGRNSDRGAVLVNIGEAAATPTPAASATPKPNRPSSGTNNNNNNTPQPTQAAAPPPSAGGAGNPGGAMELGGQVPGSLAQIGYMQAAGMNWVKFQAKWPYVGADVACSWVSSGRGSGLKVLLSVPGPLYPGSIDYGAYTEHLRAIASCQPDAVEIWNEMNLDREWPAGQIDPASYVNNMLAPGFNAIKSVSPNTIVIIGALAPTGFDNGTNAWSDQRYLQGLNAAGAANYANCVGAHHNSGTTAPSARSGRSEGDHYSWYFLPTIEVTYNAMGGKLPVCLTEFGYLTPDGFGPLPSAFSWGAGNTVAEQAAWLKEGADIGRGLGWVRLMIIWNVGFTQYDSDPQAGYSIVRPDGTCPACDLLP